MLYSLSSCGSYCDDVDSGGNGTCNDETEQCDCDSFYDGGSYEKEIRERLLSTWVGMDRENPNSTPFEV